MPKICRWLSLAKKLQFRSFPAEGKSRNIWCFFSPSEIIYFLLLLVWEMGLCFFLHSFCSARFLISRNRYDVTSYIRRETRFPQIFNDPLQKNVKRVGEFCKSNECRRTRSFHRCFRVFFSNFPWHPKIHRRREPLLAARLTAESNWDINFITYLLR